MSTRGDSVPTGKIEGARTSTAVGNIENEINPDALTYAAKLAETNICLQALVGQEVVCNVTGGGSIKWKVIPNHVPQKMPTDRSPMYIGFNFDAVDFDMNDQFVFGKMFSSLFFRDFCMAMTIMNGYAQKDGVRIFTIDEFLIGLGILFGGSCFSQKGAKLFVKSQSERTTNGRDYKSIEENPDFSKYMRYIIGFDNGSSILLRFGSTSPISILIHGGRSGT